MMKENTYPASEPKHSLLLKLLDHYQKKRYDTAEKIALQVTNEFPYHPFAWKLLGALLNQTGRASEALVACQKSVLLDPNNAEAHNNLGRTLYKLDRLEEAILNFRKSIDIDPDIALVHYNLGQAFHKAGELEQSELSYKKAISLKQNYIEAYSNLGIVLKSQGKLQEAEEVFSFAINKYGGTQLLFLNRAQLFFDKKEYEKALRDFDLCNTPRSRALSLAILHILGRNDEVFERIKAGPEEDSENLRVSAIASFIAEREKKENPHNFCKNPMDFVYFSNISSHFKDSEKFISELIDELLAINSTWEPFNKTTNKGFQSTKNLFDNPSNKISALESIILDEIDSYHNKFENENCLFIQRWPSKKRLIGWYVILKQHGNQDVHIHPSGWLSGVIYLKVVPGLGKNEGSIEFGLSGKNYSHVDSPKLLYQPKAGDIIFFPSSLHHRTIPFTSDKDRIIVAFDLKPKTFSG